MRNRRFRRLGRGRVCRVRFVRHRGYPERSANCRWSCCRCRQCVDGGGGFARHVAGAAARRIARGRGDVEHAVIRCKTSPARQCRAASRSTSAWWRQICVDRYHLVTLYERTREGRCRSRCADRTEGARLRRSGKTRTVVTKAITKVVDEDFAWKDPKGGGTGRDVDRMDYVIGGMDREFQGDARITRFARSTMPGLMPGYNERIPRRLSASRSPAGLKAAKRPVLSRRQLPRRLWPRAGGRHRERKGRDAWAATAFELKSCGNGLDAHGEEYGVRAPIPGSVIRRM